MDEQEYTVLPTDTYKIIRGCSGCGRKEEYISTNLFRVNANENKIDVWLIFQCKRCHHTYNLPIYERKNSSDIPKEEYFRFLANDSQLALQYGTDRRLFQRRHAEIDLENIIYKMVREKNTFQEHKAIWVHNPYHLKLRNEKIAAEILGVSRSKVKEWIKEGKMQIKGMDFGERYEIEMTAGN